MNLPSGARSPAGGAALPLPGAAPSDGWIAGSADAIARGDAGAAVAPAGAAIADPDDGVLLARARGGDRTAFGLLVERHHRTLAALLRQRFPGSLDVEDVLQEVFLRALTGMDRFQGRSSFLTWAASIALHRATDVLRRDARRRRLAPRVDGVEPEQVAAGGAGDPVAAAALRDEAARARSALDALPEGMRLAVTLRVVEGLEYGEVARRLDIAVPLARTWVFRGLSTLRRRLDAGEVHHA